MAVACASVSTPSGDQQVEAVARPIMARMNTALSLLVASSWTKRRSILSLSNRNLR